MSNVEKEKRSSSKRLIRGGSTERSDESSKMVYSDAETQIQEHVIPSTY